MPTPYYSKLEVDVLIQNALRETYNHIENDNVSGTFTLNHSIASDWKLTLTGATTISEVFLPLGNKTKTFTMVISGEFPLTLPEYWKTGGDDYLGSTDNFFYVKIHKGDVGAEEVSCIISNL